MNWVVMNAQSRTYWVVMNAQSRTYWVGILGKDIRSKQDGLEFISARAESRSVRAAGPAKSVRMGSAAQSTIEVRTGINLVYSWICGEEFSLN